MDKKKILGKFLNALGWLVVICAVGYGTLYVKDNINTLEGPVWDYVRKEIGTPSVSYMKKLAGRATHRTEGAIQSVDEKGFVVSMLATMDPPPPPPAGLSFEGPVRTWIVTADGGNGIYFCTLADNVLVEYDGSSTSGMAPSSEIIPKAEVMKLLTPGLVVFVGSYSGDATNINQVIYIKILIDGFKRQDAVPGEDTGVNPDDPTNSNRPYPAYLYRILKSPW